MTVVYNYFLTMRKFITTFFFCLILAQAFSQTRHKLTAYLQGEYNKTIYDRTIGNNPWGIGLGLQVLRNSASRFKLTADISAIAYLEDDKVLRLNADGSPVNAVGGMVDLFAGASFQPTQKVYVSFVAGPSFTGGLILLGIEPTLGVFFSSKQRWTVKCSYINVFDRDKKTSEDFGSINVSLGVKLF
jgi:hypothetical protein